jgi:hypothetical protein
LGANFGEDPYRDVKFDIGLDAERSLPKVHIAYPAVDAELSWAPCGCANTYIRV